MGLKNQPTSHDGEWSMKVLGRTGEYTTMGLYTQCILLKAETYHSAEVCGDLQGEW